MSNEGIARFFNRSILVLQMLFIVGIPLVFSTLTRSAFEVNKITWLKINLILILGLWGTKYLLLRGQKSVSEVAQASKNKGKKSASVKMAAPEPVSIEAPLPKKWFHLKALDWLILAWLAVDSVSTFFSVNRTSAIMGAYDRWDGWIHVIFITLLVIIFTHTIISQRHLFLLLGTMAMAAFLVSLYGFSQSLGYDFITWSGDASQRVFASINNPVHYCPYVAMMVPIVLGLLNAFAQQKGTNWKNVGIEIAVFIVMLALCWAFLVSYEFSAPAVFMALLMALGIGILGWYLGWQGTLFAIATLVYHTQVLSYSRAAWQGFFAAMVFFFIFSFKNFVDANKPKLFFMDVMMTIVTTGVFFMFYLFKVYKISWLYGGPLLGWIAIYIVFLIFCLRDYKEIGLRLLIIFALTQLQNVALGFGQLTLYLLAGVGLFGLSWKRYSKHHPNVWAWLLISFIMLAAISARPALPKMWADLTGGRVHATLSESAENVQSKVASISQIAITGSARTSMWKSGLNAWHDNWHQLLIGTGPGTVKYIFPKYRLKDYGILEGHHGATPDKFHNDYLNKLVTIGLIGFLLFYGGFVPYIIYCIVKTIHQTQDQPFMFIMAGLLGAVFTYQGQVFFNFGVVATYSLFFMVCGIGVAICMQPRTLVEGVPAEHWSGHFNLQDVPTWQLFCIPLLWLATLAGLFQSTHLWKAEYNYLLAYNAHQKAMDSKQELHFKNAAMYAQRSVDYAPLETQFRDELGKIYHDWHAYAGDNNEKKSLLLKSRDTFEECLHLQPENPWYHMYVATVYALMGSLTTDLDEQKQYSNLAEKHFEEGAADDPNNPIFLNKAGDINMQRGQYQDAVNYYSRTLEIDDRFKDIWLKRARAYDQLGQPEKATADREYVINKVKGYIVRANQAIGKQEWQAGIDELYYCVQFDPEQIHARLNMAKLYLKTNQMDEAKAALQDLLSHKPDHAEARFLLTQLENRQHQANQSFEMPTPGL